MASFTCRACLPARLTLRPSAGLLPTPTMTREAVPAALFSTSATASKAGQAFPGQRVAAKPGAPKKRGKIMQVPKKKKIERVFSGVQVGERKAFRKRVTLTNDNAIPVPDLEAIAPGSLSEAGNKGRMLTLPDVAIDRLRAIEAFKATQNWELFRAPSVLVREETLRVAQGLDRCRADKETMRMVVTGDRATGKSILMLQAITHALLDEWTVIHIPEAQELSSATTDYAPIPDTEPTMWSQPQYIQKLLKAVVKANPHLNQLKLSMEHANLPRKVAKDSSLAKLAVATADNEQAWPVWNVLWKELTAPGRPPILLTVDGIAHVMCMSKYRTPSFELIHSHDLGLVRHFMNALQGSLALPNGGAVLVATNGGNTPRIKSLELALTQRLAAIAGTEAPAAAPYGKGYDARVEAVLKTVDVLQVKGVSRAEVKVLLDYWAASGMLRSRVDDASIADKWAISGNGIIGELEKTSLLSMRLG